MKDPHPSIVSLSQSKNFEISFRNDYLDSCILFFLRTKNDGILLRSGLKISSKNREFTRLHSSTPLKDHFQNLRLFSRRVSAVLRKRRAYTCTCVCSRDYSRGTTRKFRDPIRRKFIEFTKFDTGIILVLSKDFKRSRNPSFSK